MRNMFLPHMASARWQSSFLSNATKPNLRVCSSIHHGAGLALPLFPSERDTILREGLCMNIDPRRVYRHVAGSWALHRYRLA